MELLSGFLNDRNAVIFDDVIKRGLASHVGVEYNSMMAECVLSIVLKGIEPSEYKETKAAVDACLKRAVDSKFRDNTYVV